MNKFSIVYVLFFVFIVFVSGSLLIDAQEQQIPTPKQQMNDGVDPDDVVCDFELSLMLKFATNTSVCVKFSTALKLDDRGWGSILKDSDSMEEQRQALLEKQQPIIEEREPKIEQTPPLEENIEEITESVIEENYNPEINPDDFVSTINNPYFTLIPGTTFLYESETEDAEERIEVTVTEEERKVMGVDTTVVWDRVWLEGQLIEDTRDWYAQDKKGNVWYFGEYSQEFEDGELVGTFGSWEAGVDGAMPGIIMKANPEVGEVYRQEYNKDVAEDMAEIVEIQATLRTDFGYFSNCLKTKDWTPLESDSLEYKYYCLKINNLVMEEKVVDGETVLIVDVGSEELITDITIEAAKQIALKEIPGIVTDVGREGFRGKAAYAIEIRADNGLEIDVFVDIKTGKVLGTET